MKDTVVINDKNVEVEVTAYTMLIYEDTFKGHSFLRDADRILVKNLNDVKFGSAVKLLWAAAKTADLQKNVTYFMAAIVSGAVLLILADNRRKRKHGE